MIPEEYSLEQNYPNPFNPATKIEYRISVAAPSLVEGQQVTLTVYDILGREVAQLVNQRQKPGIYEVVWDPSADGLHLSNGVYFYRIVAGNFIQTKKMILIK